MRAPELSAFISTHTTATEYFKRSIVLELLKSPEVCPSDQQAKSE